MMDLEKCFKLTIVTWVLIVLLLKENSRVVNENTSLDSGINNSI